MQSSLLLRALKKYPLESSEKRTGLFPRSGFLSVIDMSIIVIKGDSKHQLINQSIDLNLMINYSHYNDISTKSVMIVIQNLYLFSSQVNVASRYSC